MARHNVFVIVADVKDGTEEALRERLAQLDRGLQGQDGPVLSFRDLTMLHFACFVVYDRARLDANATRSKLVFECNIDGPIDEYLDALLDDPLIDTIYNHCDGYPVDGNKADKLRYLKSPDRMRRPQLYHIGAPYRSAASIKRDRELRRRLEQDLDRIMAEAPAMDPEMPAGVREFWRWDALKPWLAWVAGIGGPALAIWLAILVRGSTLPRLVTYLLTFFAGTFAVFSAVGALKLWTTALPTLRDRVRPWLSWLAVGGCIAIPIRLLWNDHREWAVSLLLGLAGAAGFKAYATVGRLANDRLVALRSGPPTPSIVSVWTAIKRQALAADEGREWGQRLLNWSVWPIAYLVIYIPVRLLEHHRWLVITLPTVLLFFKAVWLAVLLGWPAKDRWFSQVRQDYRRIFLFAIGVPAVTCVVLVVLTALECPPSLLAALLLIGVLSTWSIPVPSPDVEFKKLDRVDLAAMQSAEDREVQNHMAAVVPLNEDRWFRVPALKMFLFLLNRLYFRCWLPDLYRGKLFGIPTVQFAQWILLDKRNYLFLSNYDNSWTSYLDDFGLHLTSGIAKIWGQGAANPGTKDLVRFKDYARTTMVPHSLWYRAYPGLTLRQVWNNEQIRRQLSRARGEEAMARALRRFGAATKVLPDNFHVRNI